MNVKYIYIYVKLTIRMTYNSGQKMVNYSSPSQFSQKLEWWFVYGVNPSFSVSKKLGNCLGVVDPWWLFFGHEWGCKLPAKDEWIVGYHRVPTICRGTVLILEGSKIVIIMPNSSIALISGWCFMCIYIYIYVCFLFNCYLEWSWPILDTLPKITTF